jgi:hypothetical protein
MARPRNKELPMPEPAQVPLDQIPIVPIAEISGKLLDTGELVNLAEYAARRAEKLGQTIASLEAGIGGREGEAGRRPGGGRGQFGAGGGLPA